ncbi:MAG: helix-turn-helix domain-containing protein [Mangrovibacterium sp.]
MYFEQTNANPECFALHDLTRTDTEMLLEAIVLLRESSNMATDEFADERERLSILYKQMNSELVRSQHCKLTENKGLGVQQALGVNRQAIISQVFSIPGIKITKDVVEMAACCAFNIKKTDLYKRTRARQIVEARHSVLSYLSVSLNLSTIFIEKKTGFDHSTVVYAKKKVIELLEVDKQFRARYEKFIQNIKA